MVVRLANLHFLGADGTDSAVWMHFAVVALDHRGKIARLLLLERVIRRRVALLFTAWSAQVRQLERRLKAILDAGVLLARRRQASMLGCIVCGLGRLPALRKTAVVAAHLSARLIHSFAGILGVQVAHSVLVEIFFLDQGQVGIAFHLGQRLLPRDVLLSRAVVELAGVDGARLSTHVAHLAHVVDSLRTHHHVLLLCRQHVVLALRELPEGVLLGLHVTVVGEVRIVGAALVL